MFNNVVKCTAHFYYCLYNIVLYDVFTAAAIRVACEKQSFNANINLRILF